MAGLFFLVEGAGQLDRGQLVEGQLAVGLGIVDGFAILRLLQRRMVGPVLERPGRMAEEQEGVDGAQDQAGPHAPVEIGPHVARLVQLLPHPAVPDRLGIGGQAVGRIGAGFQGIDHGLGGQHAGLHGRVAALDLGRVEEARGAADQAAAGKAQPRHGLIAAFVERPGPVGNAPPAFQDRRDRRMGLVALQFVIGREIGVLIIQPDHEAERDLIVFQMIEERAAVGLGIQGPADGVQDFAGPVVLGLDLPQFLEADAVGLRVGGRAFRPFGPEIEFLFQRLGQMPPAAFGEQGVLGVQFHARLVVGAGGAVAVEAHVARGDALHRAVVVVQHLGGGETGIDLGAQGLRLFAQPAADEAEGDDIVAVVLHLRRRRQAQCPGRAQQQELVFARRRVQRRAFFFPVGDQLVQRPRLQHRAGQDMRPHFRAFFDDADGNLRIQLTDADGGGQARRPRAYDHHIEFHGFPFHSRRPRVLN